MSTRTNTIASSADMFLVGSLVSTLGSSLTNIALAYQFLLNDPSPSAYATILYAATVASLLFAARIGAYVDGLVSFGPTLMWVNALSAACSVGFALSGTPVLSAGIVVVSTVAMVANASAITKLVRIMYVGPRLDRVNITLNEIATFGTVFGPLLAPAIVSAGVSLRLFYFIDAATFLFAGALFGAHFRSVRYSSSPATSTRPTSSASLRLYVDGWRVLGSAQLRTYFLIFVPFVLGWSGMIYTLAILAKQMSGADAWLYSAPILAMFAGRLLAMRLLRRRQMDRVNYGVLFGSSMLLAGACLWPLGFVRDAVAFCAFEFVLGMAVAVNLLCNRVLLQRLCPLETLGTAQGLATTLEKAAKLVSVPILVTAISAWGPPVASVLLSVAYLAAGVGAITSLSAAYRRVALATSA